MLPENPVFVALDTPDLEQAVAWADAVRPRVGGVKLGLEFFNSNGPDGVRRIVDLGLPVFLDLKFHDIPNTVAGAVNAVAGLGAAIVNVHAGGGSAMLSAAATAAAEYGANRPLVVAVTVLTSLDDDDLASVGQAGPAVSQVERLARLSQSCGLDGVVCSPAEIAVLRTACGDRFRLVVPGIRPAWANAGDQKRIMTPREARDLGADVLVIGRPITGSDDPAAAAARIADELDISS
ncbi:MAG: orotidine-5'-phosphate decarboxylase [Alphaproteobacteria bacterium]|nr:orotidine-5'-phosphate decarboxylase [Alphaproteobacteria bacterium]MCZ6588191.1 orotidine-5'-phosphate decarboxylase [Alphaproteobacteria bacterium]